MKKQNGFAPIATLIVIVALTLAVSGTVFFKKQAAPALQSGPSPNPTRRPQPTLMYLPTDAAGPKATLPPRPTQQLTFPTEYACINNGDCVLKDSYYCCGERLESYQWCYHKNVEPEKPTCEGVGSCPGIAGSAKSCMCQNGKCTAGFPTEQSSQTTSSPLSPPPCKTDSDCYDAQGNPLGICNVPCQDKAVCQNGICVKPMMNLPGIQ